MADSSNNHKSVIHTDIYNRILSLTKLKVGWDGYWAGPVRQENANAALGLLQKLLISPEIPNPQIMPGVNGDLQLEWHGSSNELELHILEPDNIQVWIFNEKYPDGFEYKLTGDFTEIEKQLEIFAGLFQGITILG